MTIRQESIKKLKKAVKSKSLLMYQGVSTSPKYYDDQTNSCCAVGAILPLETLFEYMDNRGNVFVFSNKRNIDYSVDEQLGKRNTLYGMKKFELKELQKLHDKSMSNSIHGNAKARYKRQFEEYVKALK